MKEWHKDAIETHESLNFGVMLMCIAGIGAAIFAFVVLVVLFIASKT